MDKSDSLGGGARLRAYRIGGFHQKLRSCRMLRESARPIGARDQHGLIRTAGDWPLWPHADVEERHQAHVMSLDLELSLKLFGIGLRSGDDEMHASEHRDAALAFHVSPRLPSYPLGLRWRTFAFSGE